MMYPTSGGGGGGGSGGMCRCACPLCPLTYKRPADLNRHMKQKHGVSLKDFVVQRDTSANNNNNVISTSGSGRLFHFQAPAAPVTIVTDNSDIVEDAPLNLSIKDNASVNGQHSGQLMF